jgi:soluble lytic murein transglycosylase
VLRVIVLLCGQAGWLAAQTPASLALRYRASPTPARRQALVRFASQHPKDVNGALALLALGVTAVERGEYAGGARHLEAAGKRLPQLADAIGYYLGTAYSRLGQPDAARERLEAVVAASPRSPLAGRAALALAEVHMASPAPEQAVAVLKAEYSHIPQPAGDLALASACEAAGELAAAAAYAQRVYYGFPASKEAAQAGQMLDRLREKLGENYPPPLPEAMLGRAQKWLDARDFARARAEYQGLVSQLGGEAKELAQVRAGIAWYRGGGAESAFSYLKALSLIAPEADAERLYYLVECARGLEDLPAMRDFVERLGLLYPVSEWRLSALVWAGNYYLLRNDPASYVPFFRACYEAFPAAPRAEYCHWKVAWNAYLERRPEAAGMLREHLERFPQSEKRAAALYFLGRLDEEAGSRAEARAAYREIIERFPNSYYVQFAAGRLGGAGTAKPAPLDFNPGSAELPRIRRARLFSSAGLSELAEGELRFAAREGGRAHVLALELARQAGQRNAPDEGLRYIKSVFPDYLSMALDAAPLEFWRLAFPLPYRQSLQRYAKVHRLDLYLLAGLIRQESEFNPRAVSPAGARGLMQLLPATAGQMGRTFQAGRVRASSLFNADLNIRLGTYHLRSLIDGYQGSEEAGLASYNAGRQRVDEWLAWASYREPAEFVETIPFTETRGYVQAVQRNAWLYRRIYVPKREAAKPARPAAGKTGGQKRGGRP